MQLLSYCADSSVSFSSVSTSVSFQSCRIHCTYMGGYTSKEIGTTFHGTMYDEINLGNFQIHDASPGVLGRCFIEVGF